MKSISKDPLPRDSLYLNYTYQLSELEHHYGKNIHVLADPFLLSHLAKLCAENTYQPVINELITTIYLALLKTVVNQEFPTQMTKINTRMIQAHPKEGVFEGPVIDFSIPVVCVNLARAGTLPSHICYNSLNYFMDPLRVRQDHISIARTTNKSEKVTGSEVSGHKIGGNIDGAIVLFPDPMGATGSTVCKALDLYKNHGKALKFISLHCIITPEYLRKIKTEHPDLIVYSVRLDRGLSPENVLKTSPGTHWNEERGLNDKQYIVPGGGGFGEILNNAYV